MKRYEVAADFTLPDQNGESFTLSAALESGPVVLFFYPAALSLGCTKESCHFRDLEREFTELGAHVVGVSLDDVAKQARFARKNSLTFPLLADVDGSVAELYGVKRALRFLNVKRTTFVIAPDRRVLDVISSEVGLNAHADRALDALRAPTAQ